MSQGIELALILGVIVLVGFGLVVGLLLRFDHRSRLRLVKFVARIGRWFEINVEVSREGRSKVDDPDDSS